QNPERASSLLVTNVTVTRMLPMTDQPSTERKDDRLWGGRFEREPDKRFDAFQRSFSFDRRLLPYELAVDRAWAKSLVAINIITSHERDQLLAALDGIEGRATADPSWLEKAGQGAEDIHHFVERELVHELGDLG